MFWRQSGLPPGSGTNIYNLQLGEEGYTWFGGRTLMKLTLWEIRNVDDVINTAITAPSSRVIAAWINLYCSQSDKQPNTFAVV